MKETDDQATVPEGQASAVPDPNSPAERFYGGAITRILFGTLVLGIAGTAIALAIYGIRVGIALLVGAALAYWNFRSLVSTVNALADRIIIGRSREEGAVIVLRFISRIVLVGVFGYAIFLGWPGSLPGFLVGLCMPVPALMFEAGYEGFTALRRGL